VRQQRDDDDGGEGNGPLARLRPLDRPPPRRGPIGWVIPESIRNAIAEDIASGAFARALTAVTAGDPEIQDQ
jgi:hypothetical protein